ncbi:hypothetical protein BDY24DRAFT_411680 [Mrakia frigida]|uniref:uncharacterized protein n=1 Tax=Mrakia frigida TaxID=29902 RepID=UPI003FCC0535
MERFALFSSDQLVKKATDIQAQSTLLLDTLVQRHQLETKVRDDKIAQLERENASLKQIVDEMNSEIQALELEASVKREEGFNNNGGGEGLESLDASGRRSSRYDVEEEDQALLQEENEIAFLEADRSGWECENGWLRASITRAQMEKLGRSLRTANEEVRILAREISGRWSSNLYELVVLGVKPFGYSGGEVPSIRESTDRDSSKEGATTRRGRWSWNMDGYKRKEVVVVASHSPRACLETLPFELADMIVSLLTDPEKSNLGLVNFQLLRTVARTLYHAPTMSETEVISFANARLPYISEDNRIQPLLLPSTLHLKRVNAIAAFPSQLLVPPSGYSYEELEVGFEMWSYPIPIHRLNIPTDDVASPDYTLRYWSPLLHVLNPSSLQLTVGSGKDKLLPPTIFWTARLSRYTPVLTAFTKEWDRLEEVVAVGPRSVMLLQGGTGNDLAFAECLERSRVALGRGPTLYFMLETKRAGREAEEEWVSKKGLGTRLSLSPPALNGDETSCRLIMKG